MKINSFFTKTRTLSYMAKALQMAEEAFLRGDVPVGAVLVEASSGKIVTQASNEMRLKKDPTQHAEMLVIQRGLQILGEERFWNEMDIYVTLEPCPMCAQALSFARLRRIYFGAYDPKGGGIEHGPRIFENQNCNHRPEVYGGVKEEACSQLLKRFFEELR